MDSIATTPAQENYIQAIYRMSGSGSVRPSDLADNLGVRRASVSKFIATLVDKGFVQHESHGIILLTERGSALARAIVRREDCLTGLLVDVCGMSPDQASIEVHRLEHVISEEVLIRLEILVGFASSSDAWLRRLHHRIKAACSEHGGETEIRVGQAQVHPEQRRERTE